MKNTVKVTTLVSIFIGLLFLGISNSALSDCNDRLCNSTIDSVYASGRTEGVVLIKPMDSPSPLNCTLVNNTYLSLKKSHPLFNQIYSMLLAAKVSDSRVGLRISEGSSDCNISYVVLY